MFGGDKLVAKKPLSWKRSFSMGVVIPFKLGNCLECKNNSLCVKLVNQIKNFANPNESKRQSPNEYGHMLPWYKTISM